MSGEQRAREVRSVTVAVDDARERGGLAAEVALLDDLLRKKLAPADDFRIRVKLDQVLASIDPQHPRRLKGLLPLFAGGFGLAQFEVLALNCSDYFALAKTQDSESIRTVLYFSCAIVFGAVGRFGEAKEALNEALGLPEHRQQFPYETMRALLLAVEKGDSDAFRRL